MVCHRRDRARPAQQLISKEHFNSVSRRLTPKDAATQYALKANGYKSEISLFLFREAICPLR